MQHNFCLKESNALSKSAKPIRKEPEEIKKHGGFLMVLNRIMCLCKEDRQTAQMHNALSEKNVIN